MLRNQYLKASRQTERGRRAEPVHNGPDGPIAAFIVPAEQHDALTAVEMIEKLLLQGVEVQRASDDFVHEGRVYGAGSWIVSMAQPKRGLIRWLLGRTFYPDNTFTRYRDGSPIRPYDLTSRATSWPSSWAWTYGRWRRRPPYPRPPSRRTSRSRSWSGSRT